MYSLASTLDKVTTFLPHSHYLDIHSTLHNHLGHIPPIHTDFPTYQPTYPLSPHAFTTRLTTNTSLNQDLIYSTLIKSISSIKNVFPLHERHFAEARESRSSNLSLSLPPSPQASQTEQRRPSATARHGNLTHVRLPSRHVSHPTSLTTTPRTRIRPRPRPRLPIPNTPFLPSLSQAHPWSLP